MAFSGNKLDIVREALVEMSNDTIDLSSQQPTITNGPFVASPNDQGIQSKTEDQGLKYVPSVRSDSNRPNFSPRTNLFASFRMGRRDSSKLRQVSGMSFISRAYGDELPPMSSDIDGNDVPDLMKSSWTTKQRLLQKQDFLMLLSKSLVQYGAPTHRVQHHLSCLSRALDVNSSFYVIPGLILISFGQDDHNSSTHLVKTNSGCHMGKLRAVNTLCHAIVDENMDIDKAFAKLQDIIQSTNINGKLDNWIMSSPWFYLLAFPVNTFATSMLGFRLPFAEAGIASIISVVVAGLVIIGERFPHFLFVMDFAASFAASFLSRAAQSALAKSQDPNNLFVNCYNHTGVVLSAIVALLPGLILTFSIVEMSTKNFISGTVHIFHALFTSIMLGFGMTHGTASATWNNLPRAVDKASCPVAPSLYWSIPLFPLFSLTVNYFFMAHPRQYPIMIATTLLSFGMSIVFELFTTISIQVGTTIIAFLVGFVANYYARFRNEVAIAPILSGILMLLPGSLGVRSSVGFLEQAVSDGTVFASQMIVIGVSVTVGILISTLLVPPMKRSKLPSI